MEEKAIVVPVSQVASMEPSFLQCSLSSLLVSQVTFHNIVTLGHKFTNNPGLTQWISLVINQFQLNSGNSFPQ